MAKTSAAVKNRYAAKAYDRINLTVKKGAKEKLREEAEILGESLNEYIKKATAERYYNDCGDEIDL